MSVPLDGGSPVVLASGQRGAEGIAVDPDNLYWVTAIAGTLMKLPLGSGPPVTLMNDQSGSEFIALAASGIYWTSDAALMPSAPHAAKHHASIASGWREKTTRVPLVDDLMSGVDPIHRTLDEGTTLKESGTWQSENSTPTNSSEMQYG